MNENIDDFLRENKPRVSDNPAFLLEVQQKMRQVEGIKTEVDRQRRSSRRALILTLILGLAACTLLSTVAWLYPVDVHGLGEGMLDGFWSSVTHFLHQWRAYLLIPVAGLAIALGLLLGTGRPSRQARF